MPNSGERKPGGNCFNQKRLIVTSCVFRSWGAALCESWRPMRNWVRVGNLGSGEKEAMKSPSSKTRLFFPLERKRV